MSRMIALACLALTTAALGGCSFSDRVTHELLIQQAALVPAPGGAPSVGPLVDDGRVAVSGSYAASPGGSGDLAGSQTGNVVLESSAAGHLSLGAGENVELGLSVDFASGSWGTTRLSPIALGEQDGYFWSIGAHLRARVVGDQNSGLGFMAELTGGSIPFRRTGDYTLTYTEDYYDTYNFWDGGVNRGSPGPEQTLYEHHSERLQREGYAAAGVGLYGFYRPIQPLYLSAGAMFSLHPNATGFEREIVSCDTYSRSATYCDGLDELEEFDAFSPEPVVTPFVAVTGELGPVALSAQFYKPITTAALMRATPYAGEFVARFQF